MALSITSGQHRRHGVLRNDILLILKKFSYLSRKAESPISIPSSISIVLIHAVTMATFYFYYIIITQFVFVHEMISIESAARSLAL